MLGVGAVGRYGAFERAEWRVLTGALLQKGRLRKSVQSFEAPDCNKRGGRALCE